MLVLCSKSVPARPESRSFDPAQTKGSRTQIFPPLGVHGQPVPKFSVQQIRQIQWRPQARHHQLGRTSWWSSTRFVTPEGVPGSLRPSTEPARERGLQELVRTRSRITPHPSRQHSLGCGPRTTALYSTFPRRTAPHIFSLQLSLAKAATLNVERAYPLEQCRPLPLAHRAGRRPALG